MKKNLKKWFTFIEILVVTIIISILSFFSIWSFFNFYKTRNFYEKINKIDNFINTQNLKINRKDIFNYEINFKIWETYFITFENNYWNWKKISIDENILKNENKIKIIKNSKIFDKEDISDEFFLKRYIQKMINEKLNEKNLDSEEKNKIIKIINDELDKTTLNSNIKDNIIKIIYQKNLFPNIQNKIIKIINELDKNIKTPFFHIKFYKNWKKENFYTNYNNLENTEENFNWNIKIETKIFNQNNLNNILINKYDFETNIKLKAISLSKEKKNLFNQLKIENIFWRKKIYLDGKQNKKNIYLFFEDEDWKEFYFLMKN